MLKIACRIGGSSLASSNVAARNFSSRSIKFLSVCLSDLKQKSSRASSHVCVSSHRDIQHESLKGVHSHWRHSFSFVNNHYLFLACFLIVLLSIMLYLLRLRRIHRRTAQRCSPSSVPWLEEGLGSPTLPINLWTLECVKSKQLGQLFQTSRHSVWDGGIMRTFGSMAVFKRNAKKMWSFWSGKCT